MSSSLDWAGGDHVRDLGGLPTVDGGVTRRGAWIRADSLRRLVTDRGLGRSPVKLMSQQSVTVVNALSAAVRVADNRDHGHIPARRHVYRRREAV